MSFAGLPAEILLETMKHFASFSDLEWFIGTHSVFRKFFEDNQYGICGAIARTQFGQLWEHAYQLLVQQSQLYRETDSGLDFSRLALTDEENSGYICESGYGVLEQGTRIGEAEMTQLLKYKASIEQFRPRIIRGITAIQDYFLNHTEALPIVLTSSALSPDQQICIDRAFYQYLILYLACVPEATQRLGCKTAKCPGRHNMGGHSHCWKGYFESLDDEAKEAIHSILFSRIDENFPFKNSKLAIRGIEQIRLALFAMYDGNILSDILGPKKGTDSLFEELYDDSEVLVDVVKEYLEYRAKILGIEL